MSHFSVFDLKKVQMYAFKTQSIVLADGHYCTLLFFKSN